MNIALVEADGRGRPSKGVAHRTSLAGPAKGAVILENATRAHHVVDNLADAPIELDRGMVRGADLAVHLRAADQVHSLLGLSHKRPVQPLPLPSVFDDVVGATPRTVELYFIIFIRR
jgi:hypothetical protein